MAGAYEIVMEQRRELVDKIVKMMKQGRFFGNQPEWNNSMLCPANPLSQVRYRGGNRLRLMAAVVEHGYTDPRWATARQYSKNGFRIKKGEHGIPCEKWIFTKEKVIDHGDGPVSKEIIELEHPQVSYFTVFNAQQVEDFPEFEGTQKDETDFGRLINNLIDTSECPIMELAQTRAFYSGLKDQIVLPLRSQFKDEESFAKTLIHEMSHSTGHPSRLARSMGGTFGSPDYAKEELRAEIGALFMESDLGIALKGEHYEDHSDYLRSWIAVLEDDYNELFRACADAERITERLMTNYRRKYELNMDLYSIAVIDKDERVAGIPFSDRRRIRL